MSADVAQYIPPGIRPVARVRIPWPDQWGDGSGSKVVSFYPAVDSEGSLSAFMRQDRYQNPLAGDRRNYQGVYQLFNVETQELYTGSSQGATAQGRMQRTIARHLQRWERQGDRRTTPGYTLPREYAGIALFPMYGLSIKPRELEDWLIAALASYCPQSGECVAVNQQQVFARPRSRADLEYVEGMIAHYERQAERAGAAADAEAPF